MEKLLQKRGLWGLLLGLILAVSLCVSAACAAPPGGSQNPDMTGDGPPDGMDLVIPSLMEGDKVDLGFDVEKATTIVAVAVGILCAAALGFLIFRIVRSRSVRRVGAGALCVALALVLAFNVAVVRFNVVINQFLSSKGSSDEITQAEERSKQLTQELESEGIVLLKNEGDALPLAGGKVNVFGYGSNAIVYGGAGSGAGDEAKNVTFQQGLEYAGFEVNQDLVRFYKEHTQKTDTGNVFNMMGNDFNLHEPAVSEYGSVLDSAKGFSDTSVLVFSRAGGEGGDLPVDMSDYAGGEPGRHYLELNQNEEDLLEMVAENFGTVVVVINSSHAMELGFLENSGVDAAIWIGGPGSTGLNAVGEVLSGRVNPSGRLADTYAYDATSAPSYFNFGDFTYTNTIHDEPSVFGGTAKEYYKFLDYAEGIYVGYRYYETRWVDNETGV